MKTFFYSISVVTICLFAAIMPGCDSSSDADAGFGSVQFKIVGEDITYDSLTGEDGYNHVQYATIDHAYIIIKTPKINPTHAARRIGDNTRHTGISLSGMFAVDLMKNTVLGVVDSAETGSYEEEPSISIYNPVTSELLDVKDFNNALSNIPTGLSFLFGGIIVERNGTTKHTYEIREAITAKVDIEEFPTDKNGDNGTHLVVEKDQTLVAEFHPHIDHALEIICHDNQLDFSALEKEDDVIIFSETMNKEYYADIISHINRGDHWDVNVIP